MISRASLLLFLLLLTLDVSAQSLGKAGTITGTVLDPSGSAVPGATVEIRNPLTGYKRSVSSGPDGAFRLPNLPPNSYHLAVQATGFTVSERDVQVRTTLPMNLEFRMILAGSATSVTVEGFGADLLENVPYAHNDMDQSLFSKLPVGSPGSGLSDAITLGTPGVVADSNGLFHPLGDHAQVTFSVDGQPISDQQSKQFSTQLPLNAIQSMELITGAPSAEFGDKTSLVVSANTKTGLGQKPFGTVVAQYGNFGTVSEETTLGFGSAKFGNFLAANALRSGRFLDTPEFSPMHAIGNNYTVFDRLDFQLTPQDSFHLNLFSARNWFQVPTTYDQPNQDQRQKILTYNVAPGYQHTFSAKSLLTINPFYRQDKVNYYPGMDPFNDSPVTAQQARGLVNWGVRADISYVSGIHSLKFGTQLMQTRLREQFAFGVTDPGYVDPGETPGLIPFDLSRGGSLFSFAGRANVNQHAIYVQDTITLGGFVVSPGLRLDHYDGLSQATEFQPRLGVSYLVKPTGTVLRAAYSRTLETPYNENLILSSSTGAGGLAQNVLGAFGARPIEPGIRNQFNLGIQQAFDKVIQVDAEYFWKYTDNAFDFGALLDTPITFPISWRKSKLDGVSLRISTPTLHGFQAYTTMGHTRARFFGPSNGGLIFNSPLDTSVFRIDHDQAFQETTNVRYQRPHNGPWASFTWRYDSGLVAGAVPDLETAKGLTAAQQAAIGFDGTTVTRLRLPAEGTANSDRNPPRVAPRHLFNLGVGSDNLLSRERFHMTARFTVENLTNNVALYNFLSTFSGTHFVTPRAYRAEIGFAF